MIFKKMLLAVATIGLVGFIIGSAAASLWAPDSETLVRQSRLAVNTRLNSPQSPEQSVESAVRAFREEAATVLRAEADLAGITLGDGVIPSVSGDDGASVAVAAALSNAEDLSTVEMEAGADILFVFLYLPYGVDVKAGFFILSVSKLQGTGQWQAELRDLQGEVTLTAEAELDESAASQDGRCAPLLGWRAYLTLGLRCEFTIKFSLEMGDEAAVRIGLSEAGQRIFQAKQNLRDSITPALCEASQAHGLAQCRESYSLGATDGLLVINAPGSDTEDLTRERIREGADLHFVYMNLGEGAELAPGFYVARVSETAEGELQSQLLDSQRRPVVTGSAVINVQENPSTHKEISSVFDVDGVVNEICVNWEFVEVDVDTGSEITVVQLDCYSARSAGTDLSIVKSLGGDLRPEQQAAYTLAITNLGGAASADSIVVTDALPTSLSLISATGEGWSCSGFLQAVACSRTAPLAGGESSTIQLIAQVRAAAGTQITNCAQVSLDADTNADNNRSCHSTNVQGGSDTSD